MQLTPYGEAMSHAKELARNKIYLSESKTKIELAGYEIIGGVLDCLVPAVIEREEIACSDLSQRSRKYLRILDASDYCASAKGIHESLLAVTDFVSGMTDRYALDLYRA